MTIDEAIRVSDRDSIMDNKAEVEARNVIIDALRKYQKMQGVLDEIREQIKSHLRGVEITLEVLVENDPLRSKFEGAKETLEECLEIIDKAESEKK